jgi:hypothetical protein
LLADTVGASAELAGLVEFILVRSKQLGAAQPFPFQRMTGVASAILAIVAITKFNVIYSYCAIDYFK